MSQRIKDIHIDFIIVDQWTEPHSPWQNPAELDGVKFLKPHAQVLLDRTGALLRRSLVRYAADDSHRNKIVSFKSDVQESLKLSDTKLCFA
jgi:hypothetical protein